MIDRVLSGKSINPEPQPVYVQRQERTEVSKFESQVPPQTRAPRKSNLQEFIEKNIESPPPPQRDLSPVGPGKPAHQQPVTTQVRPQQSMASALSEVNVVARGVASITRNESQQSSFFRDEAGSLDGYFKELPPLIGGNSQQTLPSQASRPPVIAQSIQQQNTYSQFSSQSGAPSYPREVYNNPSVSISRAAPANPSYVSHQASNQMSYRVSNQESFGAERSAVRNQRDSKEGSLEFEKKITSNDSSLSVDPNSHREMTNQVYKVTPPTRPMDFKPAPVQSTTTTTSRTQTITQNRSQSPPSKPLAKLPSTKKAQIRMKKDMVAHSHLNQITEEDDENRSQYRQYEEDDEDDFMEDDQSVSSPRYQQGPIVVEVEKPKNESYSQFDDYNYADNRREFGLESEIPNLMPDQYIVRGGLPGRGYEASRVQSGSSQVQSGISRVQSGASQIQSGTSRFQPGPSQIQTGASRVQPGFSQMQSGTTLLQPAGSNPNRMQFESQIKESKLSSIDRSQAQGGFGASAFGAFDDSVQEQSFAQSRANYGTNQTGESRVIENTSQFGFNTPSPRGNAGSRQQSSLNYTEGSQKSSLNHGSEESKKYNAGYNQSSYSQNEDQYTSQYLGNDQNQGRNQKSSRIANSNVSGMNRAPVGFSAFGSVQSVEISKIVANERFW